ncbi:hypothetical protein CEP69_07165 [Citrobacter braakii]|nr:hypothetical protein CEP69_07165 [Citrobacter braakii]AUV27451.1 hypothetical protein C2U38_18525 [Citrobacter freundii complex sp. CFNIH3]POV71850.1 hypothetical protein C3411_07215 [Citrobacter freundii complex sp. CFNIH5]
MHCKWFFVTLRCKGYIVKNMHHKPEKKSVEIQQTFVLQSLACREGNRLRKILCQDLLSKNDSVILFAVVQRDCLFRPKFYC